MPSRKRRFLWPALLLVAAGVAFAWWVLHPVPAPRPVHRPQAPSQATRAAVRRTQLPAPSLSTAPGSAATSAPSGELAIIIDDAGQWLDTERAFIALPIPITLSVLPDVRYTHVIAQEASAAGKGVMLHLPMEPISEINPGPGKIMTTMSDAKITAQVDADLADVPLAQGVNNHEGSKATANPRVMRDVASAIAAHGGLFFVDSLTSAASVAAETTRAAGIPTATRDVFLDDEANVKYVEQQLRLAATIARERGTAIAIGHPRPTTLDALRAMIPRIERQGVRFVLVRDVVAQPTMQPSARQRSR
jgi:uncharacterized protein